MGEGKNRKKKEGQKLVCSGKVCHIAKPERMECKNILEEWGAKIKPVHKKVFLNCIIGRSPSPGYQNHSAFMEETTRKNFKRKKNTLAL